MRSNRLAALVTVAAAITAAGAGCKGERAPAAPTTADWERGYTTVAQLRKGLQQALTRAMVHGAPTAVTACATEAPAIAAGLAQHGVIVGRATRRPRNPANLAAGWQADALAQFEADAAAGRRLETQRFLRPLPGDRLGYAEPLVIQPLCLACHGVDVAPEVAAALAERYPDDRATGYQLGELRGVIWAELPARPQ